MIYCGKGLLSLGDTGILVHFDFTFTCSKPLVLAEI